MAVVLHSVQTPATGNHIVPRWSVANDLARAALTLGATDVGGVCEQLSDATFWWLTAVGPANWAQIGFSPIPVLNVYLSTAGNDANDGLTPATAVATFSRVWQLLPQVLAQPFVVHVDGGTAATLGTSYAYSAPPAVQFIGPNAMIVVYGDGAGQGTNDGFYTVGTGTLAAGTTNKQLVLSAPVGANAYRYCNVLLTSGPAQGHVRGVVQNTTTIIYPACTYAANDGAGTPITPLAGDSYRVVRPNVELAMDGANLLALPGAHVHFVNVAFTNATNYEIVTGSYLESLWYGVELRTTAAMAIESSSIYCGMAGSVPDASTFEPVYSQTVFPLLLSALGNPVALASGAWNGWGLTAFGGSVQLLDSGPMVAQHLHLQGYFAVNAQILLTGDQWLYAYGLACTSVVLDKSAEASIDSWGLDSGFTRICIDAGSVGSCIAADNKSRVNVGLLNPAATLFLTQNTPAFASTLLAATNSLITISCAVSGTALAGGVSLLEVLGGAIISIWGSVNLAAAASGSAATVTNAMLNVDYTGQLTLAAPNKAALLGGRLHVARTATCSITASADKALDAQQCSIVVNEGTLSLAGTLAADGAVLLRGAGTTMDCVTTGGTTTVRNNSGGANADGMRIEQGAACTLPANASVTTAGASGYGMRLRAHGLVTFPSQPTAVTGPTNDFLVDATAAAKAGLGANVAVIGAGASVAVSMT